MFKILCNFLFIFFILFFEAYSYENSDIKPYSLHQIFLTCSENKTTFIKNNKEKVSIIISDNLDLNCFKSLNKTLSKSNEIKINKTYINELKFTTNNSIQEKFQYQILEFLNPTYLSCGEKCNFSKH